MNNTQESAKCLKEKADDIAKEMRVITDKVTAEKRNLASAEKEMLGNLDQQRDQLLERAETLEKVEHVNNLTQMEVRNQIISSPYHQGARPFKSHEERGKALAGWFLHGSDKQKPEFYRAAEREGLDVTCRSLRITPNPWIGGAAINPEEYQLRSSSGQTVGTAGAGGDIVPVDNQLAAAIDVATKWYGRILETSTVIDTSSGAALPYPLMDDTGNSGAYVAEQGAVSTLDIALTKNTLNAYKITSDALNVSWELLNDSIIPLVSFIGTALGTRLGRKLNNEIINGSGSSAINGMVNTVTSIYQSTSTDTAGPTYNDLCGVLEQIDESYQQDPSMGWIFNQNFRSLLRQIVDGNSRPIIWSLLETVAVGMRTQLLDHPFYVNAAVPTWGHTGSGTGAQGKLSAFVGALRKVLVRRVVGGEGGYNFVRNDYVNGMSCETMFFIWGRFDSIVSDAGQHPIVALRAPAS